MRKHYDKSDLRSLIELGDAENTEEERQQARLAVCGYAADATLARDLLDELGLLP